MTPHEQVELFHLCLAPENRVEGPAELLEELESPGRTAAVALEEEDEVVVTWIAAQPFRRLIRRRCCQGSAFG